MGKWVRAVIVNLRLDRELSGPLEMGPGPGAVAGEYVRRAPGKGGEEEATSWAFDNDGGIGCIPLEYSAHPSAWVEAMSSAWTRRLFRTHVIENHSDRETIIVRSSDAKLPVESG